MDDNGNILYSGTDSSNFRFNRTPNEISTINLTHQLTKPNDAGASGDKGIIRWYDYVRIWDEDLAPKSVTAAYADSKELDGAKNTDLSFEATVNFSKAVTAEDLNSISVSAGKVTVNSLSADGKTAKLQLSSLPEFSSCTLTVPSIGGNNAASFTFVTKMDKEYIYRAEFNGLVIIDNRLSCDDDRLRTLHHKLMITNHEGYTQFNNLIEGLFIAPSHLSVGVQFADLVAGAIFRKYENNDTRFYDKIAKSIRNRNGKVDGVGIVKFPKQI